MADITKLATALAEATAKLAVAQENRNIAFATYKPAKMAYKRAVRHFENTQRELLAAVNQK